MALFFSCSENHNEKELLNRIHQSDSLRHILYEIQNERDSLYAVLGENNDLCLSKNDISFSVVTSNPYLLTKGKDLIVEANILLIPDSSSFWAVAGELKADDYDYYQYQELESVTDTIYPSKQSNYQNILIHTSTENDTVGLNEIYYNLFFELKKGEVIRAQVKHEYWVASDSASATSTRNPE